MAAKKKTKTTSKGSPAKKKGTSTKSKRRPAAKRSSTKRGVLGTAKRAVGDILSGAAVGAVEGAAGEIQSAIGGKGAKDTSSSAKPKKAPASRTGR